MRKSSDPFERFLRFVHPLPTGCWAWTGAVQEKPPSPWNYGIFGYTTGRTCRAHRWAYEYFIGPIPEGLHTDHLCRNPNCVNPTHVEPVTKAVNTLRGNSLATQHARQTHCVNGHEFTQENTYRWSGPGQPRMRVCRTCRDARQRRRRAA